MKQVATLLLLSAMFTGQSIANKSVPKNTSDETNPANKFTNNTEVNNLNNIPLESLYQLMAAELALSREEFGIALANYIAAANATRDPAIAERATLIALSVATLEVALEPALLWATVSPNSLEAQITMAALYIRAEQPDNAVNFLEKIIKLDPEGASQHFMSLFQQLTNSADNLRVVNTLEKLAAKQPNYPGIHMALAEIYLLKGKDEQALDSSQNALRLNPKSNTAISLYSNAIYRVKGKEVAVTFLQKKLKESPNDPTLKSYYINFLLENADISAAKQQMQDLIAYEGLTAKQLLEYARVCMQAEWFDLAEQVLLRAKDNQEIKDTAHYFLARLKEMQDQDEAAVEWFKQVLTGPFHVLSQIRASIILTKHKKYDEALDILSKASPNSSQDYRKILLSKIDILIAANKAQQALDLVSKNLQYSPEDSELLYARSLVALKLNNISVAEEDLKNILSKNPNQIDALNALGYLLADKTSRYNEAFFYLNKAIELAPNNPAILDSMGWLQYKMGNYEESLEFLKKAAQLTVDAEIAAHLGEVMWKLKDYTGAKAVWSKALEQHPDHESLLEVMNKFLNSDQKKNDLKPL